MATRFCFIDYDREMAIVAELEHEGKKRWPGWGGWSPIRTSGSRVRGAGGRPLAEPRPGQPADGLLPGDRPRLEIRKVFAETSQDNRRMLAIFKRRGFELDYSGAPDAVEAKLNLAKGLRPPHSPSVDSDVTARM